MNLMSCEEIQIVLDEWARGGLVDAESSGPALLHAKGCDACGEFLEMSQALTRALGAWREDEAHLEAPPRVEKELRLVLRTRVGGGWRAPVFIGVGTAAAAALAGPARREQRLDAGSSAGQCILACPGHR